MRAGPFGRGAARAQLPGVAEVVAELDGVLEPLTVASWLPGAGGGLADAPGGAERRGRHLGGADRGVVGRRRPDADAGLVAGARHAGWTALCDAGAPGRGSRRSP